MVEQDINSSSHENIVLSDSPAGEGMDLFSSEKTLARLSALIDDRVAKSQSPSIEAFACRYYKYVPEQDLAAASLDDIYGAVLSHWNFAQHRKPGQAKIRVFNPSLEQHGWQSSHTVIEIVVEDMPFLVQSITMGINRFGLTNHLTIHPVLAISRSKDGKLSAYHPESTPDSVMESFIHVEVDRQSGEKVLTALSKNISRVLNHVRAANEDWEKCLDKVKSTCEMVSKQKTVVPKQEVEEAVAFLRWLLEGHFVFLGFREYEVINKQGKKGLKIIPGAGLGILQDGLASPGIDGFVELSDDAFDWVSQPALLTITKATTESLVHRPVFMDYVGVKRFDKKGKVVGEMRFLGLYSSSAYRSTLGQVPIVRKKVKRVFQRSGFGVNSHSGRSLSHILEDLPRDELFYSPDEELFQCAMGVLLLRDRQRVRVFVRHDVYGRFFSAIVYVPRENFHTDNRTKIQNILLEAFNGQSIEFRVKLSESNLARIYFIVHVCESCVIDFDVNEIEQKIIEAIHEWNDGLKEALIGHFGEEKGNHLFSAYGDGFSAAYREDFTPRTSVIDLDHLEQLKDTSMQIMLYRPLELTGSHLRFKLYCRGAHAPLSNSLPMLENMGVKVVDERPYEITKKDIGASFWIHDFGVSYENADALDIETLKPLFQKTFERVWYGQVENDGFNRLVIKAGLGWKPISLFRGFYFYLRQIGMAFSQTYVETTLANNPKVVRLLLDFFDARFNPRRADPEAGKQWVNRIEEQIDQVTSLDEDRILRRFLNLIQAAVRTNYFQNKADDKGIPYFSIKFEPAVVHELPAPRPYYEIFVYSPRVEGVHLRGGMVARGGLRWSDRREDFRTEILGLLKAQMSKNAIIVPTGAKGGFIAKQLPESVSRDQIQQEGIGCYRLFIQGLLDITDNLVGTEVQKPNNTVCHDGDDPYLVVAADKGTATFSDIANAIANEYGFWLGDAFASGGSIGYDHKKMGITARGAWESVKHHFSEMGIDIQKTPFTVVGVGDMAGDVFGNGMLLSKQIRLLAAFNHEHIFLDPDPDPKASFKERKRLFELPRSSWMQYHKDLISQGGGVFSRKLKSIAISKEVKAVFGIEADKLTPNELIGALLKAPVDLLWNGGIGTYVKASVERHVDVGDRANDNVRADATELRCKVVGEGGNLGFTQQARIEFALLEGRINTDSVDNSAGVDCSDHEVNIKILLDRIVAQGELTEKQRNRLLENMTDEVAALVLCNNYLQVRAISMIEQQSVELLALHRRIIIKLEQQGRLDRSLENLAGEEELDERKAQGKGLVRPEISVLVAYSKMLLKDELLSNFAQFDSDLMRQELGYYFPTVLGDSYKNELCNHYLSREIIANQLVNSLVNRLGMAFPFRMMDETGASVADLVTVYRDASDIFAIPELWREIESLDGVVDQAILREMIVQVRRLLERTMFWLQHNFRSIETEAGVCLDLKSGAEALSGAILKLLPSAEHNAVCEQIERLIEGKVPHKVATKIACLNGLFSCLDVIAVSRTSNRSLMDIAKVFLVVDQKLQLSCLRSQISSLPRDDYWASLARTAVRDDFHNACRVLIYKVLQSKGRSPNKMIDGWWTRNQLAIERYQKVIHDFQLERALELEKTTVAVKALHAIAQSC